MTSPVTTVGRAASLREASRILEGKGFRHIPVVDVDGLLVGMLSDRDLRSSRPSSLDGKAGKPGEDPFTGAAVGEIMALKPLSLTLTSTLDDALRSFTAHKFGALPVVDGEGRVAGIFSVQDLLDAYRGLFGVGEPGSVLVEIEDDGREGLMVSIVAAIEEKGVSMSRLIRVPGEKGVAPPIIYLRVSTCNLHALHEAFSSRSIPMLIDRPGEDDGRP